MAQHLKKIDQVLNFLRANTEISAGQASARLSTQGISADPKTIRNLRAKHQIPCTYSRVFEIDTFTPEKLAALDEDLAKVYGKHIRGAMTQLAKKYDVERYNLYAYVQRKNTQTKNEAEAKAKTNGTPQNGIKWQYKTREYREGNAIVRVHLRQGEQA